MRKLKKSPKIVSFLLLGLFLISLLILPIISNTLNPTQTQKSLTQDNFTPEQKSPIQDDIPPKPSAPAEDIIYTKTFNITNSTDDAHRWISPLTESDDVTILLGIGNGIDNSVGIGLRWNIDVPKNARIINAYINLTVANNNTFGIEYDGFHTYIRAFNEPSTNDFSDPNELLIDRPLWGGNYFGWETTNLDPDGEVFINQTLQTSNIKDLLTNVMEFNDWNGIFGVYIFPDLGIDGLEGLRFWSYDGSLDVGKPEYTPKLIVEYEVSPYFTDLPGDITINNETLGYHINWTAKDNNPSYYRIFGNETINGQFEEVQRGEWQSGVNITYDIPKIDIKNYDSIIIIYNITVFDVDGYFEYDIVFVNVTDKELPTMTDIKFIQSNKEVDYFQPGGGNFSVQIYNETALSPKITLSAFFPFYDFEAWKIKFFQYFEGGEIIQVNVCIWIEPETDNKFTYKTDSEPKFEYNSELDCWELTPTIDKYKWLLYMYMWKFGYEVYTWDYYIPVQDIRYNVVNKFLIGIMGGGDPEFVCKGRVYGGGWGQCKYEILNDDLSPPAYSEPEFIEPDEPDKHYEITIKTATEENGAEVEDVFLYYSVDNGPWEEVKMVLRALGETKYYGEIPPQEQDSEITYYIRIVDKAGNVAETDEYTEKAAIFEEPSLIIPILGVFIAVLGSLSIVAIYRHKRKAALKKLRSEKSPKKSEKGIKKGHKLLQKIKKVRKKQ